MVLHYMSLTILSIFMVELFFKLIALGKEFFHHKLEIFDAFVIISSFILDIISLVYEEAFAALELLVLLRLWRIVRVVNGKLKYTQSDFTTSCVGLKNHTYAGFRLACRLPLCRVIIACCFRVAALSGVVFGFITERYRFRVEQNWTVCDLPWLGKRQGYRSVGLPLRAAWSSLCGKWRLRSWTNIIKAEMRQAAS